MRIYRIAQTEEEKRWDKNKPGLKIDPLLQPEPDTAELDENKAYQYMEKVDEHAYNMLEEYHNKKRKKGTNMSWTVIPFARVKKIWIDYAKTGFVRDIKGMDKIADMAINIVARIHACNVLSGHSQEGSEMYMENYPEIKDEFDFYWQFINTKYGEPVSDFGLPKLEAIAAKLYMAETPEQKLILVDRMFNIVHQRGDLSMLFVEGGRESLDELFGR